MRVLAALILAGAVAPGRAQFMKALVNPNVEVTWTHPPSLGIPVRRVAFAPAADPGETALVAACTRDLAGAGQVEVVDRDRVAAAFRDLGLNPAAPVDAAAARALGQALEGPVLITPRIQALRTDRTRRALLPQPQDERSSHGAGGFYLARTRVALRATIQAVDCATGRTFQTRTLASRPFSERTSPRAQAPFPPGLPLRERALGRVRTRLRRMVSPWTTRHRIIFFDDPDFGLGDAFQALKARDVPGALERSRRALEAVRAHPGAPARILGRANFNLGICHFLLGDYPAALPFLKAALAAAPDSAMFRQAAAECEHAMQLRDQ